MNKTIQILLFLLFGQIVFAQQNILIKGSVFDAESGEPIPEVNIMIKGTSIGTITDKNGMYSILIKSKNDTIVYSHVMYNTVEKNYYASNIKADILFEMTVNLLPVAVVKPVVNISKGMLLDVTDYIFVGDSIMYVGYCYRYKKNKNPWIVMIAPDGDTVFAQHIGFEGKFYRDCMNNIHYLTEDKAYQIFIENDSLSLLYPTDIAEFKSIMDDCKFESNGKFLFSQFSDKNQILIYYCTDTVTYETEIFRTIMDEVKLNMLAFQGRFFSMGPAPTDADLRFEEMMFKPVFAPVIKVNDTISIINYTDSRIEWFDTSFNELGNTSIHFQNSKFCENEIVIDEVSGKIYAVFLRNAETMVKEIFIHDGTTGENISIPDFYWIDNIQVRNNKLYFLYREKYSGDFRALYRMNLE